MKKCCLNCQGFAYWDGDYCCVPNMKILQYGNGKIWMNEDLIRTMEYNKDCEDYEYTSYHKHYEEEYRKLIDYIKMQDELDKFVNDYSGYYKMYKI